LRKMMQLHIGEINRLEQEQIHALNQRLPFSIPHLYETSPDRPS
jgi:hypothetical protein